MKSGKKQFAVILLLMLALFMQMEGMLPDISARSAELVVLKDNIDGMEFRVEIDGSSFAAGDEVLIKAVITNKSKEPISYYSGTAAYGTPSVVAATLVSVDGSSRFSDKLAFDNEGAVSDTEVLQGVLMPGNSIFADFVMLPYYKENRSIKLAAPGEYILTLCYTKETNQVIKAEFPVTVVKKFGKMNIKG